MHIEVPIRTRFGKKFLNGMSNHDMEVGDFKNMKIKDHPNTIELDRVFAKNTLAL